MFGRTVLNHRSHTSTLDYQSNRAPYCHSSTENQGITWWQQQDPTVPNAPQALVADLRAQHTGSDLPKHVLPVYPTNIYCVKGHYAFDPNPHNWMSTTDPANPIHQATEVSLPPLDFMAGCNIATCADSQDEHHDHVEQQQLTMDIDETQLTYFTDEVPFHLHPQERALNRKYQYKPGVRDRDVPHYSAIRPPCTPESESADTRRLLNVYDHLGNLNHRRCPSPGEYPADEQPSFMLHMATSIPDRSVPSDHMETKHATKWGIGP